MKRNSPGRTIRVDALARVEGEGALTIRYRGDQVRDVALRIYEPPRFFEAFLRGRMYDEVPDITARICGICPVAYQMSSAAAMEDALGVRVDERIHALRRLLYLGEWIESHALHVFLLHAPDFLGCQDAVEMARRHGPVVRRGLRIKKAGNALLRTIGGREIHPVNPRVGGFHRAIRREELEALLPELRWGRDAILETLDWIAGFSFPEYERDYEFVAVREDGVYPIFGPRIVSSGGLDIDVHQWEQHFQEHQVAHSNALHATIRERGAYLCGPMARFNLAFDRLRPVAREAAERVRIPVPCRNPFRSILVRAVEIVHAFDEAITLIENYRPPEPSFVQAALRASTGYGVTEAPRGALVHWYGIDERGILESARIIPPTSQNQTSIEEDLAGIAPRLLRMPQEDARWLAEQTVRNYDPCISCATHFLRLDLEEEAR